MEKLSGLLVFSWVWLFFAAPFAFADDACTVCHDVLSQANVHEPAIFDCTTCHAVHGDTMPTPGNLKAPINELCLGCHDAKLLDIDPNGRGHIIDNHPLSGPTDPLHPEKPLSCASCHNPHSSNQEKFFRYDYTQAPYDNNFCAVCHWDIAGGSGSKPPTPPWAPWPTK